MHVVDNFIQSDLYCIPSIHFVMNSLGIKSMTLTLLVTKLNRLKDSMLMLNDLLCDSIYIFVVVLTEVLISNSLTKYQHKNF